MGFLSKFEGKMEDAVEGAASSLGGGGLSPVQITKKAEKQMRREKMVGAGKQYAPTLYTILVSREDDARMFSYYPTLAGEIETYLMAKAAELGLMMDGQPLVRFIDDPELKRGKFDVVAELVASPIVARLREEEMQRYGIENPSAMRARGGMNSNRAARGAQAGAGAGYAGAGIQPMQPMQSAVMNPMQFLSQGQPQGGYQPIQPGSVQPQDGYYAEDASSFYNGYGQQNMGYNVGMGDDPATMMYGQSSGAQSGGSAADVPHSELDAYLYDESRDKAYALTGGVQHIGRESGNEIVVPDINVSRQHAEIRMDPSGTWVITDLNSTNGVYVNNRQVKSCPLRDADIILLGTTELEFQLLS